ncbi:hypothetical protein Tcan_00956, partial [Toxocara canis]
PFVIGWYNQRSNYGTAKLKSTFASRRVLKVGRNGGHSLEKRKQLVVEGHLNICLTKGGKLELRFRPYFEDGCRWDDHMSPPYWAFNAMHTELSVNLCRSREVW